MSKWTIVSGDFVTTGGMDLANFELASFLARKGHSVELVSHRVAPDLLEISGVSTRTVSKPLGSYTLGSWPLSWAGYRAGKETYKCQGRVLVNGGNCPFPDINWVHYVHAAYRPAIPASYIRRLKFSVERPIDLHSERVALQAARLTICNSEKTRRDVIYLLGIPEKRTRVIYYGCDAERFLPANEVERNAIRSRVRWPMDRPIVIFIGALGDRRKGFDVLFEAWIKLCRHKEWEALLMVIGRGAELPLWERRARESGLMDSIRFLGFRSDVPDLLRAADVLVSPTRYEAYGLGVSEALCCGLPAIVSANAGVAERYPADLSDLLLNDFENSDELFDRLWNWRLDVSRFATRVRPFSDQLRSGSWDAMAQQILLATESVS